MNKSAGTEIEEEDMEPFKILVPHLVGKPEHEGQYHQAKNEDPQVFINEELGMYGLFRAHVTLLWWFQLNYIHEKKSIEQFVDNCKGYPARRAG